MDDLPDFALPALDPSLRISRAPDSEGEPAWTIHHPASDKYYKIDWPAFECLSRMGNVRMASELEKVIKSETALHITRQQIADIVVFLQSNGLVALKDQIVQTRDEKPLPLWKKALHSYLYFTIPLFRPQAFLRRTYPRISFLFGRPFLYGVIGFLLLIVCVTLPRIDEFFHTFTKVLSFEGAAAILIVLAFVKVVHEFSHAYTATKYGVDVPHMGVAFLVMYPILYTETTGSWKLSSRRARFHIGMAGIMAELCLAAVFLGLWHLAPAGSTLQTLCFIVVGVSLISSLLVNLNPLMRFDGYYMFSDLVGVDNLQYRACAFARWKLRKILFGLDDAPPEALAPDRQKLLIGFGTALLIYRFFLFTSIALLVYHLFFQPLGFLLMMVELGWFILLPIWSELKVWWMRRIDILLHRRSVIPLTAFIFSFLFVASPWKGSITIPAVLHAARQETVYAPSPAQIVSINVEEGIAVRAGDKLLELSAPELTAKLESARQSYESLQRLRDRAQTNPALMNDEGLSDAALEKARVAVESLRKQAYRLVVHAPFDGTIRDLSQDIQAGRFVPVRDPLFVIVGNDGAKVSAYADEGEQEKIENGVNAVFYPANILDHGTAWTVEKVGATGGASIVWAELASVFGGPVPADQDAQGRIVSRRTLYEVNAKPRAGSAFAPDVVIKGYLRIDTIRESYLSKWIKGIIAIIRREGNLG